MLCTNQIIYFRESPRNLCHVEDILERQKEVNGGRVRSLASLGNMISRAFTQSKERKKQKIGSQQKGRYKERERWRTRAREREGRREKDLPFLSSFDSRKLTKPPNINERLVATTDSTE